MRKKATTVIKTAIIVEIIICYMSVLTVVSYARGSERYKASEAPVLNSEFITSFAGERRQPEDALPVINSVFGNAVGWAGDVDLRGLDAIEISFRVVCSSEYVGRKLYVDLYDYETQYDSPEQEFVMEMQSGINEANFMLIPEPNHPDKCQLRFFTTDIAEYEITDLRMKEEIRLPQIPTGCLIGMALCFIVLAVTVLIKRLLYRRGSGGDEK